MIIAAYAATGKSTFSAQMERAVDLPCMPYKWILPPAEETGAVLESEKGAMYHLRDLRFPDNYIADILRAEREYDFVLIPTDMAVVERLQVDYGRKVVLCYPSDDCREEYRKRFIIRGNSQSFLRLFADRWEGFLSPVRENPLGIHIVMAPGEHLTDLRWRLEEERCADQTPPVPDETIHTLEKTLEDQRKNLVLYLPADDGPCFYAITDLELPDERKFLYEIGCQIFGCDMDIVPLIASKNTFRPESVEAFLAKDRNAVRVFVRKHRKPCV